MYQVSSHGRVMNKKTRRILKPGNISGYCGVVLRKDGKSSLKYIHRLMMEAFVPTDNDSLVVNHKDEVRDNNYIYVNEDGSIDLAKSNLEWCDTGYNLNYGTAQDRRVLSWRKNLKTKKVIGFDGVHKYGIYFSSTKDAAEYVGGKCENGIRACCKGKCKKAYGYVWEYVY